jgi:hypothetical protein
MAGGRGATAALVKPHAGRHKAYDALYPRYRQLAELVREFHRKE